MKVRLLLTALLSYGLLNQQSCEIRVPNQADFPSWSINLEIPLGRHTVSLDELLTSDLVTKIPVNDQGDSIFAFKDTVIIEKVEVGDQLEIDDLQQSFSQNIDDVRVEANQQSFASGLDEVGIDPVTKLVTSELGTITLDDTEPQTTAPILMTEIVVDLSQVPEGQQVTINQAEDIPEILRDITFNNFDDAHFSNGYLELTIDNSLLIELGYPVTVELLRKDLSVIPGAVAVWQSGINPGAHETRQIGLSGTVLPGEIVVKITGKICGSASAQITNNNDTRNSFFTVTVQAKRLEVTQAMAIIPEQTIDTTGVINLEESGDKVKRAKILRGNLQLQITNTLPVMGEMVLKIGSLDTLSGAPIDTFTKVIPLIPEKKASYTYALNGYIIKSDIDDQKIEYSYHVKTYDSGTKVQIDQDDGVVVNLAFQGASAEEILTFFEFEGLVDHEPIVEEGEIDITTSSQITWASVMQGTITITIDNRLNLNTSGNPSLQLSIPEIRDGNDNGILINRTLAPGITVIPLPLVNYRLVPQTDFVTADSFRQKISYSSIVTVPSDELVYMNLLDSIDVDIQVGELQFDQVTGYFHQEAMVDENVIELDQATKVSFAHIKAGNLHLVINNYIGVIANVRFRVNEFTKYGQPLRVVFDIPDGVGQVDTTISIAGYDINMPLNDQMIHYRSTVSLPEDQEMTLHLTDGIDVEVYINSLAFESVAGLIDTVTVELAEVEQEVEALPKQMEGINLADVDMQLVLETNIGVPVELNLNLMAYNDKGDTVRKSVTQVITDDPVVIIPEPQDLLNIRPDKIVASGSAKVGGAGSVTTQQYVKGQLLITVPMELEITDDAVIDLEPNFVEKKEITEGLEILTIIAEMDNQFSFGALIEVLAARDTLHFAAGSPVRPDTLAIFGIDPAVQCLDSIILDEKQFRLFDEDLYVKSIVRMLPYIDQYGQQQNARFMANDSLKILLYGRIRAKIDLANSN